MPLSLSNRDQNSGHLFYNRRLRAATTKFTVRMKHDDRKQTAAIALSIVLVLIGMGWMVLLNVLKPSGQVGDSAIIGDRDSGAIYARIDGRLYPALNVISARLATGTAGSPTWVKPAEVEKYPPGPRIGIPGAPETMPVQTGAPSAWAVCDTAGAPRSGDKPVVTAIAGVLSGVGRAEPLAEGSAVWVTFQNNSYVLWGGKRSQIDPGDRAVTSSLGIDPGVTFPVEISRALFDGLPATEPLRVPVVPGAGGDSRWMPGSKVGTVLETQTAGGGVQYYVLLGDGVQKISSFVADLLRSANSFGATEPRAVSPDVLVDIPEVNILQVGYYPPSRMKFVDSVANPVNCVGWEKGSTDPQARVTVYSGRGLPVSSGMDSRIVSLVRDDRGPDSVVAHNVLVLPGDELRHLDQRCARRPFAGVAVLGVQQRRAIRHRKRRPDAACARVAGQGRPAGSVAAAAGVRGRPGAVSAGGNVGARHGGRAGIGASLAHPGGTSTSCAARAGSRGIAGVGQRLSAVFVFG